MTSTAVSPVVFWHRSLPPYDAEAVGEHTLEATSERVHGLLKHGQDLWNQCTASLMRATNARLEQELARLGGHYAHVLNESIEPRRDEATGEMWLHGRFSYVLYRKPDVR